MRAGTVALGQGRSRRGQQRVTILLPQGRQILLQQEQFRILSANLPMQASSVCLFEEITVGMLHLAQELERPKLRNTFTLAGSEVQLTLTDNFLFLAPTTLSRPSHFLALSFAVKFEVVYVGGGGEEVGRGTGLRLEREGCTETVTVGGAAGVVQAWALELEKRINQRNFHKLFKAKRKIGKGAFATVYLAERLRDHKMVAVKAFSKEKQYAGEKGRDSLENEIRLMRKLNHRNTMKLEGVYETENSIYVILEYLEGSQLNDLLKTGRKLEPEETRTILEGLLKGLAHLARCRIIHRDLKPENVMFRRGQGWEVAICDFGLATYADEERYLFVRCGTPGFVAPEIINIRDMTTKSHPISDIFSAGVIFHHLLLGCSVFEGKKYNEILAQNRACDFDFTRDPYTKLPPAAFELLTRMLEKDPARRISAETALVHPYFTGTELEHEPKLFRELSNYSSPSHLKQKDLERTPSSLGQSLQGKAPFLELRREQRQLRY